MKPDELYFLPLGGAGEIGMNLNLYGYGGKWLMVDLGITFADESLPGVDVLVPDPTWIVAHRDKLVALVVTHAHEDHIGAIAYLWPQLQCPVFATAFAAAVLRPKLEEAGLLDQVPLSVFPPGELLELGPFRVTSIAITHSIPEAQALAIETPAGVVLHSGDWKLDPEPLIGPASDVDALSRYGEGGVLALVCDSTNVFREGVSGSEATVREGLLETLRHREGRIAVTTFASNVARLESIAETAKQLDRHVCLVGRSLYRFVEAARQSGYLQNTEPFLTERDIGYVPANKVLLLCTGSQGEPRGAMARIAAGDHPHVALGPGDTALFSSKIIPGNERALARVHNQLALRGVEVITEQDALVHVSGHPARDELAEMYRLVRPRIAVPVHGEPRHLVEHAKLAKSLQVPRALVPRNGQMFRLAPGEPELVDEVPAGRLAVDAGALISPQGRILQTRRRLMYNGAVMVTLVIDAQGMPLTAPKVALHGVAEGEDGSFAVDLAAAIETGLAKLSPGERADDAVVAEAARRIARRRVKEACGRRPVTEVQLVRLPAAAAAQGKREAFG